MLKRAAIYSNVTLKILNFSNIYRIFQAYRESFNGSAGDLLSLEPDSEFL